MPLVPKFYRTVLPHDNQSTNAVRTVSTIVFEAISYQLQVALVRN